MANANGKNMKQIVGAIRGNDNKSHWTRIGVAFENRDGSFNLVLDYIPADLAKTTIQLRDFEPRQDGKPADEAAAPGFGDAQA